MEIEFELVNNKEITIFGIENNERKEIGRIFTPSNNMENRKESGNSTSDNPKAIQVCGFTKIYDLWGCGVYGKKENLIDKDELNKSIITQLINRKVTHYKDIQLQFDFNTDKIRDNDTLNNCHRCYNNPCTCREIADDLSGMINKLVVEKI